jgi:uncharacterized protein YdeI (YjbR/CyaY-like superfamily)
MQISNSVSPKDRQEWRDWLSQHYLSEKEVWLVYSKAHTRLPSIPYEDTVEEALCFGWIDSIIQRIDEDSYARKFTPRTNTLKWSEVNKRRAAKCIREGRMTPAGLAKLVGMETLQAEVTKDGLEMLGELAASLEETPPRRTREVYVPPAIEQAIRDNPAAWANYLKLAPSTRRRYMGWVLSAKRDETVQKRLQEVLHHLEEGTPMGLK